MWAMRTRYPFMGKRRLRVMLRREGLQLSESSIGRILAKGLRLGRIRPCAFCRGRVKLKRRRRFDGHAQRWRYGQRAARPGELVQIDHMSLHRDGKHLKEFKAVSPLGKQLVARAYARATAHSAKRFLQAVQADLPHPLLSIQVDGGSEFMADFEQACRDLGIPLYVLPPGAPSSTAAWNAPTTPPAWSSGTSTRAASPSPTPTSPWPSTSTSTTTCGPTKPSTGKPRTSIFYPPRTPPLSPTSPEPAQPLDQCSYALA